MPSAWVARLPRKRGVGYRVFFRVGGRESVPRHGGSFSTMRDAKLRRDWIAGELAAMRVPHLRLVAPEKAAETVATACERWRASRVDVSEPTRVLHRVALDRVLPVLGTRPVKEITTADVSDLVTALAAAGKRRETIRKSVKYLAAVLDECGLDPNPARRSRFASRTRSTRSLSRRPPSTWRPCIGSWLPPTGFRSSGSTGRVLGSHPSTR